MIPVRGNTRHPTAPSIPKTLMYSQTDSCQSPSRVTSTLHNTNYLTIETPQTAPFPTFSDYVPPQVTHKLTILFYFERAKGGGLVNVLCAGPGGVVIPFLHTQKFSQKSETSPDRASIPRFCQN
jgi:hypothetical protein